MHTTIDLITKWLLFLACLAVFILHLITSNSISSFLSLFQYYTIQSNAIVLLVFGMYLLMDYKIIPTKSMMPLLLAIATGLILVTGIIFHLFLSNLFQPTGLGVITNFLEHTFVPFGTFLYFILIFKAYQPNKKDLPLFVVYPFLYAVVSLIRGEMTGFYPYWFINPHGSYPSGIGSYVNVGLFIVGVVIFYTILCFILLRIYAYFTCKLQF